MQSGPEGGGGAFPVGRAPVSYEQLRRAWAIRGFSCAIWVDPPGQAWEGFVHATDELVMPVEGSIEILFAGKTVRPKVGEEILIPAGARHTVRNIGRTVSRWYYGYRQR